VDCDEFDDCNYFDNAWGTAEIPIVHWHPAQSVYCGCICDAGTCNYKDICHVLLDSILNSNAESISEFNITPGSEECLQVRPTEEKAACCEDASCEDPINSCECKPGDGRNQDPIWSACVTPVLDILSLSECFYIIIEAGTPTDCNSTNRVTIGRAEWLE
jgi:hypothetical protein